MMGREGDYFGIPDEGPVHEQCFEQPFWMDKYEMDKLTVCQLSL